MSAYEINWDDNFLPLFGTPIHIPANAILWRGYDPQYLVISDRPAYYGSQEFAQGYADKYSTIASPFITSHPIKLIDIRYMKVLLSQLFDHNMPHTKTDITIISATTISFGLCSLQHQIKLFKDRYKAIYSSAVSNPVFDSLKLGINNLEKLLIPNSIYEQQGLRIAETTNDSIVMGFLKELFHKYYDGYISPNITTPFHIEKNNFILNSEIVIFNPLYSGIKLLSGYPNTVKPLTINGCILQQGMSYAKIDTRGMSTAYYAKIKGGNKKPNTQLCDDYNHLYDTGDKNINKLYKEGIRIGKKWKTKSVKLYSSVQPSPSVDPMIFEDIVNQHTFKYHDIIDKNNPI